MKKHGPERKSTEEREKIGLAKNKKKERRTNRNEERKGREKNEEKKKNTVRRKKRKVQIAHMETEAEIRAFLENQSQNWA